MGRRTVTGFADKPEKQPGTVVVRYGKANGIAGTLLRQPRTAVGIAKIAAFVEIPIGWFGALVAGSRTLSLPAAAQRQAQGVQPSGIIELVGRHKEWAGHEVFSLGKGNCIRERIDG
jgi:hypothetical protein